MMNLTWNCVAIALSLTAATPVAGEPGVAELRDAANKLRRASADAGPLGRITYQVRVVETEGLGWREAWFGSLAPVARRGTATIWTTPSRVSRPIIAKASKIVASPPKVTTTAQTAAHFSSKANRSLVTRVSWEGEDPAASSEAIREGFATTIIGRKLDQGVLVQVVIDDTEVRGVHTVKLAHAAGAQETCQAAGAASCAKETQKEVAAPEKGKATTTEKGKATTAKAVASTCCDESKAAPEGLTLQVPEIASQEIAGEWLIPNDGSLIVGFGIHTAAGADGKAVVRERLMIIEACDAGVMRTAFRDQDSTPRPSPSAAPLPSPSSLPSPSPVVPSPSSIPAPVPVMPEPGKAIRTPALPSRSMPQGIHADGSLSDLPPLPEDEFATEPEGSAEPHGSPQTRPGGVESKSTPAATKPAPAGKTVDAGANRAGYTTAEAAGSTCPVARVAKAAGKLQWSQVRLQTIPASLNRWIESVRSVAPKTICSDCDDDSAACSGCDEE